MTLDLLMEQDFNQLLDHEKENSVSIYLPTHREGQETQQDPIRFKNLLEKAEDRLMAAEIRRPQVEEYLIPLRNLLDSAEFWNNQAEGLAVFYSADQIRFYRLPCDFDEMVMIDDRFYLSPLVPVLRDHQAYFTLALSRDKIRLFEGTLMSVTEIDLGETPTSLATALRFDDPEQDLQMHTGSSSPGTDGGEVYHGHHPENDEEKDILRFLHLIDEGVRKQIGEENAPLILAGVDSLVSLYREVNSYPHLLEDHLSGNPDELRPEELRKASWEIIEPYLDFQRQQALDDYYALVEQDQATDQLEKVVPAAVNGRVDTLFVPLGEQIWGGYHPEDQAVELKSRDEPESRDLLELAVRHTLRNGGMVYAVESEELPTDSPGAAAVFRY